jgi:hypothetical protein
LRLPVAGMGKRKETTPKQLKIKNEKSKVGIRIVEFGVKITEVNFHTQLSSVFSKII